MSAVGEEGDALQPVLPREHLIAAAVRFLSSPKVAASSDQQKAAFLKKKGLTDDEINEAFLRSSSVSYSVERTMRTCTTMGGRPTSRLLAALQTACHVIVVFFGGSYIIYLIVKRYVIPWLTGQRRHSQEEKLARLQRSLDESVRSMQTCLQHLQTQVGDQQRSLDRLSRDVSPEPPSPNMQQELSQLRAEVSSLKALLLNRRQFAAAPSPPPVAAIPSWQLAKSDPPAGDHKQSAAKAGSTSSSGDIVIVSGNNSDASDHHSDN